MNRPYVSLVALRVQPRASDDAVVGEHDGVIRVRLKAAPVDGQANAALRRFLARRLGVAPSAVELVRGATGREKWIRVDGLSAEAVRAALLADH
ncbi:MAG: hypothetical protein RLZZ423_331 [Cyanobacteriota bacterium]|jgi:uncharacterized protein (TIGR00251 family)